MTSPSPLVIRVEKFIEASPMDIWRAIVDPTKFFITFVGIQFVGPFETGKVTAHETGDEKGLVWVEEATPGKRLAIRWNYDPEDGKTFVKERSTLVEFDLTEQAGGTILRFIESEFENLPEDIRQASFDSVNGGWPAIFDEFAKLAERAQDAWLVAQSYGMVKASVDTIWNAVKDLKLFTHLSRFEGEVRAGNVVTLYFGEDHQGLPILIEKVAKGEKQGELAFRWHHVETKPGAPFDRAETTLVDISMMEMQEGTWVIFRESEFDNLKEEDRLRIFEQQSKAWEGGVDLFAAMFEEGKLK
jgi:uncharacterized protein YndB with AHSA1/START domain